MALKLNLVFEQVDVFTYTVVDKALKEFKPSADYFNLVYRGMVHRFPAEYVNKYLIDHCNDLGNAEQKNSRDKPISRQRQHRFPFY